MFLVFKVGGRYDNGLAAGLFARTANNASSNANANNGGRLLVSDLSSIAPARSMPLGKNTGLSRFHSKGLEANKEGISQMPKRVGFLYEKMCNKDLIRIAIINSSRHKRHRHDVQKVIRNMDKYVDKTYDLLLAEAFRPSMPKK